MSEHEEFKTPPPIQAFRDNANNPDAPPVEEIFGMSEDGFPMQSYIVRDHSKFRAVVDLQLGWIPALLGDPEAEGSELTEEERESMTKMPVMVVTSVPVNQLGDDEQDRESILYLVNDSRTISHMITSGINMFTQNVEATNIIGGIVHAAISAFTDDSEDGGPHGPGCTCGEEDDDDHQSEQAG